MKRLIFSLLTIALLTISPSAKSHEIIVPKAASCAQLLEAPAGTYTYFVQRQAILRADASYGRLPRFRDPMEEMEIAQTWKPEVGPKGLMEMMPEGADFRTGFITHSLYEADSLGLVKNHGPGVFASVRAEVKWNGQWVGTNVGVNTMALATNIGKKNKYLAREDAHAVILNIHGGGTKTTGHQVAAQQMNHLHPYNIDVISIDAPWHGEGPRVFFKDHWDLFDGYLYEFVSKFIPPNVPLFIYGHSMGGQYADMMMRLTDNPNFKLGQRVSGFIIAAPVADLAPGGSLRDKSRAERAVQQMLKQEENWHRIAPADINISRQMAIDGKTSPVGSAHAGFLGLFLDWTMPAHKGAKYKPAVVIIGNGDGLTRIGNEEAMDSSYGQLLNIVWYIVQSNRVNMLTGQVDELVGHVNLDYFAPNTQEVEVYKVLRDLIAHVTGREPKASGGVQGKDPHQPYARLLQLYANHLGFREFAKEYIFQERVSLAKIEELDKEYEELKKKFSAHPYVVAVNKIRKNRKLTAEEAEQQIAAIPESPGYEEAKAANQRMEDIYAMRSLKYIPRDENGAWAAANIEERAAVSQEGQALANEMQQAKKEMQALAQRRAKLENEIAELLNTAEPSEALKLAYDQAEEMLLAQIAKDEEMQKGISEYGIELIEKGQMTPENQANLPAELRKVIAEFADLSDAYQETRNKLYAIEREEALKGHLGLELQRAYSELYGLSYLTEGQPAANSVNGSIRDLSARMVELEAKILANKDRQFQLEEEYVNKIVPDIFNTVRIPLSEVLENPQKYPKQVDKAFSLWWSMYTSRSPDDDLTRRR